MPEWDNGLVGKQDTHTGPAVCSSPASPAYLPLVGRATNTFLCHCSQPADAENWQQRLEPLNEMKGFVEQALRMDVSLCGAESEVLSTVFRVSVRSCLVL